MSCINLNSEEYINLENEAIEAGLDPVSLQAKIILWQKNNNVNTFPTFDEIKYYGENSNLQESLNVLNNNLNTEKSPITDISNEIWNSLTEEERNKILECN